jgi:uncharacterized protein
MIKNLKIDEERRYVKPTPGTKVSRARPPQVGGRRLVRKNSALSPEVQEFLRKFQEWTDSFHNPTRRMVYIQQVCKRIAERYHPEKIILFGSHAWGQPTPESDIDLLIVMDFAGSPVRQAISISRALGLITPMDLLLRTPEQVQERLRIGDPFLQDIWQRGKVMYEARHG